MVLIFKWDISNQGVMNSDNEFIQALSRTLRRLHMDLFRRDSGIGYFRRSRKVVGLRSEVNVEQMQPLKTGFSSNVINLPAISKLL